MRIVAIDVGTSSVKAAVLDVTTAEPVGPIARETYVLDRPTEEAAELPVKRVWEAIARAVRSLGAPKDVAALGMSCLTPSLVLLDAKDEPLLSSWTHLDRRSRPAAREVWAEVGPEFHATTGNRPLPGGMSAICWRQILDDNPAMKMKVRSYLHLNGWIGFHLTGRKAFDPANASFTGLFATLGDQKWSPRWLDYFNVLPHWLPEIIPGDETLGKLRAEIASELGLPPGIPVKLGTADTTSAMLAADVGVGELLHSVGTTQVLATRVTRPSPGPRRLVRRLGVGNDFLYVTHNPVGGAALEWMRQLCFFDETPEQFYDETAELAFHRVTSVRLDPPYLGGDRLELEACEAGFRHVTLGTHRLDLLAAVFHAMEEGHHEALQALGMGAPFSRVCITGRAAKIVQKLFADIERVEFLDEGSLRGVARLFG